MADAKLAMSLDDLIASTQRKNTKASRAQGGERPPRQQAPTGARKGLKGAGGGGGGGGGGAPRRQQRPQQQHQQQQMQPQIIEEVVYVQEPPAPRRNRNTGNANLGVRTGRVQKRDYIDVPAEVIREVPGQRPRAPYGAGRSGPAPEGRWSHDMFQDDYGPVRRTSAPATIAAVSSKLIIRNLHHDVSPDDLLELFSTCGTVKSHAVNFDDSGRSLGTGYVLFETRAEAMAAKKEYHGVKLDNQAMEIYFADEAGAKGATALGRGARLASGITVTKPGTGGGGGGGGGAGGSRGPGSVHGGQRLAAAAFRDSAAGGRGGGRGGRGNRLRSAVVGRAQLDTDLQDYMME